MCACARIHLCSKMKNEKKWKRRKRVEVSLGERRGGRRERCDLSLYRETISPETALLLSTIPGCTRASCPTEEEEMKRDNCAHLRIALLSASEFHPPLKVIQICCSNAALGWLTVKRHRKDESCPVNFWTRTRNPSNHPSKIARRFKRHCGFSSRHFEIARKLFLFLFTILNICCLARYSLEMYTSCIIVEILTTRSACRICFPILFSCFLIRMLRKITCNHFCDYLSTACASTGPRDAHESCLDQNTKSVFARGRPARRKEAAVYGKWKSHTQASLSLANAERWNIHQSGCLPWWRGPAHPLYFVITLPDPSYHLKPASPTASTSVSIIAS